MRGQRYFFLFFHPYPTTVLRLFRTNQFLTGILFLPYLALFYSAVFLVKWPAPPVQPGYFGGMLYEWALTLPPLAYSGISVLLVVLQAMTVSFLVRDNRLDTEFNLLPGLVFCLLSGMIPEFLGALPVMAGSFFVLLALWDLIRVYRQPVVTGLIFNAGFWIAVASLFYFSYAVFLFWALAGFSYLRFFNLRDLLALLMGFIVPYLLLGTVLFWLDELPVFLQTQFTENISLLNFQQVASTGMTYAKLALFGVLVVLALLSTGFYLFKKNMQTQKKIGLLFIMLLFSGLAILFQRQTGLVNLYLTVIPLSIFFSLNFTGMPRQWGEVIHLLGIMLALVFLFQPYLFPA